MKPSIANKLDSLAERHTELGMLLSTPEVISSQDKFRAFSRELSDLEEVVATYKDYKDAIDELEALNEMLKDDDPEIKAEAESEIKQVKQNIETIEEKIKILLLPKDPHDGSNIFLEIRAGTGGDEAAIFVGDLFRMYARYAETKRWKVETVSQSESDQGGYKEIIARIAGENVYSHLKFESGAHRVQRVPTTESQGRIHTSACTVAILPEVESIDDINIENKDLRIDTYRSSGAGGQHVNTTDSAVRITHIPTGIVVECQDERSQHKNKAKAMSLLGARILSHEQEKQQKETAAARKSLVGSGDRSERIRTYNYPQGRVTDHRINLTLYKLPEIVEGDLDCVVGPLMHEHQLNLLAEVAE